MSLVLPFSLLEVLVSVIAVVFGGEVCPVCDVAVSGRECVFCTRVWMRTFDACVKGGVRQYTVFVCNAGDVDYGDAEYWCYHFGVRGMTKG